MGEGPNVHAEVLLGAGRRYGDAMLARDKAIRGWKQGMDRTELDAACNAGKEAQHNLESAARAYATRMRRTVNKAPPSTAGGPGAGTAEEG